MYDDSALVYECLWNASDEFHSVLPLPIRVKECRLIPTFFRLLRKKSEKERQIIYSFDKLEWYSSQHEWLKMKNRINNLDNFSYKKAVKEKNLMTSLNNYFHFFVVILIDVRKAIKLHDKSIQKLSSLSRSERSHNTITPYHFTLKRVLSWT